MTWGCKRCRNCYQGDFPDRIDTWRDEELIAHSVSNDATLCFGCALYLLWSRFFNGGIRKYWDEYYKTSDAFQLGNKSRYNQSCRKF